MDEYKVLTVWELLDFLKQKVKQNAEIIQKNTTAMFHAKSNSDEAAESYSQLFGALSQENASLTKENTKLLSIFNGLLELSKLFGNRLLTRENEEKLKNETFNFSEEELEEYINKTLKGDLPINDSNPYIHHSLFLDKLLDRCQAEEMYEQCAEILKLKSVIKS